MALMKTNPSARKAVKTRRAVVCAGVALVLAGTFFLGLSLAGRVPQAAAAQSECPPVPNASLGDLFAAVR